MRYLVTSALPYVHGIPHLGNFVGSIFPADVTSRFLRLQGKEVLFICGSDMHGSPLEVTALREGKDIRELAYRNHKKIKEILEKYHISTDLYGHTDSEKNKEITYDFFFSLLENGYIVEESVTMYFCEGHNGFLADRWVEGRCPYCGGLARGDQCDDCGAIISSGELVDPRCVYCGSEKITLRETKQLAIDLPKLERELKNFYEEKGSNWPKNAKKITEHYLYVDGLKPRSITRHLKFGFRVPLEGYEDQVFYVWFDAPIGYIGITAELTDNWEKWWKSKDTFLIQYMGKDNVFFHTILWPAILIGSKKGYITPDFIASSEYLKAKDVKFSKSRGVGLNLESALEIMPADYWRYVLAAIYPGRKDMEFSWEIVVEKVDGELAGNIGNFIHRTLTLCHRKYGNMEIKGCDGEELEKIKNIVDEIEEKYLRWMEFQEVTKLINKLAHEGNRLLNEREPWKEDDPSTTLATALHYAKAIAVCLYPITPESCWKIMEYMGYKKFSWNTSKEIGKFRVSKPTVVFRKVGKIIEAAKERFSEGNGVEIDDVVNSNMKVGLIKHVEKIKNRERLLLIIEFHGRTYRAAPKIANKYRPDDLKGKPVLFIPTSEKSVENVRVNAYVPLVKGMIITTKKNVFGKVL